ncbi:MAG: STAS domain-containing protein [Gemmatimonadetes bacterium]|nr:STAS domain-containing protein [Gemmatimonadota bacterium]
MFRAARAAGRRTEEDVLKEPDRPERAIAAPPQLDRDTRADFRKAAVEALDALPEGTGRLIVDLSLTRLVDSAGLGCLILVQQHAAGRRQAVRLRGVSDEVRLLLQLTKLDELFETEGRA